MESANEGTNVTLLVDVMFTTVKIEREVARKSYPLN